MLKQIILITSLVVIPVLGTSISPVVYAEDKPIIGVIEWRSAIFSTDEAKKENSRIQKQFKKDTQKLKSLESKVSADRKKLEKRSELLSDKQKEALLADLQNNLLEYQTLGQEVQQKIKEKEQEFIKKQTPRIQKIVEEISEEKNLHAVMHVDAVIYGRLTVDITKEVIDALNGKGKNKKKG